MSSFPSLSDLARITAAQTRSISAENATTYFQIPSDRVVEIGTQIVV